MRQIHIVNEWIDGLMDGLMDEWIDEWIDEWMDGWMDGWKRYRLIHVYVDGGRNRGENEWTDE